VNVNLYNHQKIVYLELLILFYWLHLVFSFKLLIVYFAMTDFIDIFLNIRIIKY